MSIWSVGWFLSMRWPVLASEVRLLRYSTPNTGSVGERNCIGRMPRLSGSVEV
jgi:hypothetical protein